MYLCQCHQPIQTETTTSRQLKEVQNKTNYENGHLVFEFVFLVFFLNIRNTRCLFSEFVLFCTILTGFASGWFSKKNNNEA